MAAFKPIDPKRDEFRRYLERAGVIEALTKVFVRLIRERERPDDPMQYLRSNLGDHLHQSDSVAYLQGELAEARSKIQHLREIIERIDPAELQEAQESASGEHQQVANGIAVESSLSNHSKEHVDMENNQDVATTKATTCMDGAVAMAAASVTSELSANASETFTTAAAKEELLLVAAVNNLHINNTNSSITSTAQGCINDPEA